MTPARGPPKIDGMTALTVLPELDYENLDDAGEAHRRIAQARAASPVAMGAHGPEVLTYDLCRAILRDDRFVVPQGFALPSQGITSGPLWDRAASSLLCLEGDEHHRLRRLIEYRNASQGRGPRRAQVLEHLEILDAVAANDRKKAAALMRAHLAGALREKVLPDNLLA